MCVLWVGVVSCNGKLGNPLLGPQKKWREPLLDYSPGGEDFA